MSGEVKRTSIPQACYKGKGIVPEGRESGEMNVLEEVVEDVVDVSRC